LPVKTAFSYFIPRTSRTDVVPSDEHVLAAEVVVVLRLDPAVVAAL
jgi:hypothetical protein